MSAEYYIFGSLRAGEIDPDSDVDVLAIVEGSEERSNLPVTWSVYTKEAIRSHFARGTLFAWHLYSDALLIWPKQRSGFIEELGPPAEYAHGKTEIAGLISVLHEAIAALYGGANSPVFEHGLVAMCCRDIAMAASIHVNGHFEFSRFAPFRLDLVTFPLKLERYTLALQCRRATVRGINPPILGQGNSLSHAELDGILAWADQVLDKHSHL